MNKDQLQQIARANNLGGVWFEWRVAINTGKYFEVGYVYHEDGSRELFCKRQSSSTVDDFYLCNEYRKLEK